MIARMKAALALCLFFAATLFAQTGDSKLKEPKVRTGSRVPGVTVQFATQDGGDYRFYIHNRSGHGITAYEVLLVPSGVKMKNNHFLCQGRCSESHEVKTIDEPAIKAGGIVAVTYDAATVTGGVVILESAIFDDATYAGNERAAAYLVAQQLGQQEEFDRIVFAVGQVMEGSGPQNLDKANRIYSALAGLSTDADSPEIVTFDRWFPNLRDCAQSFPQVMKSAAMPMVAGVESRLEPLLSSNPSDAMLAQWWSATEQFMAQFGCSGCTARMASPTPPVKKRMISIGCSGQQPPVPQGTPVLAWTADDSETADEGADDGSDQVADAGSAGDQDSGDDELSMTEEPGDATPAESAKAAGNTSPVISPALSTPAPATSSVPSRVSPSVSVTSRHIPMAPRLHPFPPIEHGVNAGPVSIEAAAAGELRPVPDEQLYERYFQYVTQWTKYLLNGGTLEVAKRAQSPDPFPATLNSAARNAVTTAAYDYVRARQEWLTKMRPSSAGDATAAVRAPVNLPWEPPSAPGAGAPDPRQAADKRQEERDALVKAELDKIRVQMGPAAYRRFDAQVHELLHASPRRWERKPLPENTMLLYYLRYVAAMDRSAENSAQGDWVELAKRRVDAQQASGLSDQEQTILQQVADDLQQTIRERQAQAMANRPGGSTTVARLTAPAMAAAASPGDPSSIAVPAGVGLPSPAGQRIGESYLVQLKAKLGEAGFEKVEKRAHALYGSITTRRVVAVSEGNRNTKQAKGSKLRSEQQ